MMVSRRGGKVARASSPPGLLFIAASLVLAAKPSLSGSGGTTACFAASSRFHSLPRHGAPYPTTSRCHVPILGQRTSVFAPSARARNVINARMDSGQGMRSFIATVAVLSLTIGAPGYASAPAPAPLGCSDLEDGVLEEAGSLQTCLGLSEYLKQGRGGLNTQQQYAASAVAPGVFPAFNALESAVSGAAAGAARSVSILMTYPLDTIKTRKQLRRGGRGGVVDAVGGAGKAVGGGGGGDRGEKAAEKEDSLDAKAGGGKDLFKGWEIRLLVAAPSQALFFVTHDLVWTSLTGAGLNLSPRLIELTASLAAVFPSNFVRIPSEALKQRLQAGTAPNALQAAKDIIGSEGVKGLYRGSGAMLAREVPWTMSQFFVFAELTRQLPIWLGSPLSVGETSGVGLVAAGFAAMLTQPLDVIKTRQMVERKGNGVLDDAGTIIKQEGVTALWLGAPYRVALVGLGGGVYFWAHEVVDRFFQ